MARRARRRNGLAAAIDGGAAKPYRAGFGDVIVEADREGRHACAATNGARPPRHLTPAGTATAAAGFVLPFVRLRKPRKAPMSAPLVPAPGPMACPPPFDIRPEGPCDAPAIEALLDRAFGPGRFAKASERVREIAPLRPDLSFCAWEGGRLAGVVRQSEIVVGGAPLIFLGPLAVESGLRRLGAGAQLVEHACQAAARAGARAVLLVGDPPFFGRLGFSAEATGAIVMPGPVNPRRLLLRPLAQGGDRDLAGNPLQGAVAAP